MEDDQSSGVWLPLGGGVGVSGYEFALFANRVAQWYHPFGQWWPAKLGFRSPARYVCVWKPIIYDKKISLQWCCLRDLVVVVVVVRKEVSNQADIVKIAAKSGGDNKVVAAANRKGILAWLCVWVIRNSCPARGRYQRDDF